MITMIGNTIGMSTKSFGTLHEFGSNMGDMVIGLMEARMLGGQCVLERRTCGWCHCFANIIKAIVLGAIVI